MRFNTKGTNFDRHFRFVYILQAKHTHVPLVKSDVLANIPLDSILSYDGLFC